MYCSTMWFSGTVTVGENERKRKQEKKEEIVRYAQFIYENSVIKE